CEIDERRRSAKSGGARAGFEVVGARGSTEWHVEVRMHVDPTGDHILTPCIDDSRSVVAGKSLANGGNLSAPDSDGARVCVSRRGHTAICDDGIEAHDDVLPDQ